MDAIEKKTMNLIRFGTPNPSLLKRIAGSIIGNNLLTPYVNQESFWTAIYNYKSANKDDLVNKGYGQNVTVYSVIKLISTVAAQSTWNIYKVKDAKAYNRYKAIQKQPYSQKQSFELLKTKEDALQPDNSHYLNHVFQHPNEQQSGAEYMENLLGFKLLTGDSYELANMTDAKRLAELWVLPSQNIEIKTGSYGEFPMRELGYEMQFGTGSIKYTQEEINHSRYWSPYYNGDGSHLYGFSPLDAAYINVLQDNNAREAAVELLKNRGQRGIFTFESDAIKDYSQYVEQKGALKSEWSQNTKEYKDKISPMFGRGQWHSIGMGAKDLAILEICNMNKDDICNAYSVNSILLNNNSQATDNNYLHARKALITNAVLPLLGSIRDSRNRKLQGDWANRNENIVCEFDQTIFTELDSDKKAIAEWMNIAACFTDNEKRIQLGYESLTNPLSEDVWKTKNAIPMSMINENTLNSNNNGIQKPL